MGKKAYGLGFDALVRFPSLFLFIYLFILILYRKVKEEEAWRSEKKWLKTSFDGERNGKHRIKKEKNH